MVSKKLTFLKPFLGIHQNVEVNLERVGSETQKSDNQQNRQREKGNTQDKLVKGIPRCQPSKQALRATSPQWRKCKGSQRKLFNNNKKHI